MLYNERIENLINIALASGELTENARDVLLNAADEEGIDLDEFEMVLDARLAEIQAKEDEKRLQQEIELEKAKAAAQAKAPKSNKRGEVKKCPACGAIVSDYQVKCPECDYEFSGLEANESATKLFDSLTQAESIEQQVAIIENFPIPTSKADLLEFLASLQPKTNEYNSVLGYIGKFFSFKSKKDKRLAKAYLNKYKECVNKAQTFFAKDPAFTQYINYLAKATQYKLIAAGILVTIFVVIILLLAISNNQSIRQTDSDECYAAMTKEIGKGDVEKAQQYYDECTDIKTNEMMKILFQAYLENGELEKAQQIYNDVASLDRKEYTISLYDYCMKNQLFDEAEQYLSVGNHTWQENVKQYKGGHSAKDKLLIPYYEHLRKVVEMLCAEGKKEEAKTFVDEKLVIYESYYVEDNTSKRNRNSTRRDSRRESRRETRQASQLSGWTKEEVAMKLMEIIEK